VTVTGNGGGSVAGGNGLLSCTDSCKIQLTEPGQSPVELTATAAPSGANGSAFDGWGGACKARGAEQTCEVTVSRDTTVTADFIFTVG
jgi:hypothetical protein